MALTDLLNSHRPKLDEYEKIYKHLHANPELSTVEVQTAKLIKDHLSQHFAGPDFSITSDVGGHGLFAVLKNGGGPTVLLRADMDALPLVEKTGLEYQSTVKQADPSHDGVERGVMHACGHDFHVTSLLAAIKTLHSARSAWSGTLVFLFQPAEERGSPYGAQAMVDDGLFDPQKKACPIPDIVLGQHVFPIRAGTVATGYGTVMSAADSFKITIHGSGGHGSQPHRCVDPVVISSHVVVKLQTIVSREVPPGELACVTVGSIQAGFSENVIADEAVLKIDIRSKTEHWRQRILESIKRIVRAECQAGRCPKEPTFDRTREFPLTENDDDTVDKVAGAFDQFFGDRHMKNFPNAMGSEDFSVIARAVAKPYCFWFFGGHAQDVWDKHEKEGTLPDLPINHSPYFAPAIHPTLQTGADCLVLAALAFVGEQAS